MQPIAHLNDIKVYFPYLMDRKTTLKEYQKDILSYLLLVDKIILPPDHIFNENVVLSNVNFLRENDLLSQLFKNGYLITTSTDKTIRDYKDLIEHRSNRINITIPNFSLATFLRDIHFQQDAYKSFFVEKFSLIKKKIYEKDKANQLTNFVKSDQSNQTHPNVLKEINRLKFDKSNKKLIQDTVQLAKIAYLKAGADGNCSIMPTIDSTTDYTFFNDYYSLKFVRQFSDRLSKKIGCDIVDLSFEKFQSIMHVLKPFKNTYFEETNKYKSDNDEVYNVFKELNQSDKYRIYKNGINEVLNFVIDNAISRLFEGLNPQGMYSDMAESVKNGATYIIESRNIVEKALSKINIFSNNRLFVNDTILLDRFGFVVGKFDNGLKLI
jgi:hypothetical protein